VTRGLGARAAEFQLEARPRAEEHVAVAAASILARGAFVQGIRRLSEECGVDLPLGAGDPVESALRKVASVVGFEGLAKIAKVHFKTTEKVLGRLFPRESP
jgi:ribonuclease HIII